MAIRKTNKRILILCEGETEYFYAKALQQELPRRLQRAVSVEISYSSQHDPGSLAAAAAAKASQARRDRNAYDAVWIFFDHDNWPQLENAFRIIFREKFRAAYSAICIEHWFILHFEHCGRAFQHAGEAQAYLKQFWPAYHKTRLRHYDVLKPRLEEAIGRAVQIRQHSPGEVALHRKNPFCTVDELVGFFRELGAD